MRLLCYLAEGRGAKVGQGRMSDCNEDYYVFLMEEDSGIMVAP